MTGLKLKSTIAFNRNLSNGLRGAVVLLAVTSLFACSQPDSSVSDTSITSASTEDVAVASKTTELNVINAPMLISASNPDLLKNVSATVYKDPHCGCCKEWISHAEDNGLSATAHDVEDVSVVKERYSVPNEMQSCHTIVTADDYVFEGHVPAKYMAQFLENPPAQAIGLAVPGMPMGSPGMEHQNQFDSYQVMQLNKDGTTEVYANIDSVEQQI